MGAKGGVGASTVSHNVAWAIARNLDASTVIVDLDIAYGTAGLDFNQDPPQGIAEAVFAPERLDANMLDRLLGVLALADGRLQEVQLVPDGVAGFNPAFDVTPARLVDALLTEHGMVAASLAGIEAVLTATAASRASP
jgi:hypothetical protein